MSMLRSTYKVMNIALCLVHQEWYHLAVPTSTP